MGIIQLEVHTFLNWIQKEELSMCLPLSVKAVEFISILIQLG